MKNFIKYSSRVPLVGLHETGTVKKPRLFYLFSFLYILSHLTVVGTRYTRHCVT